MKDRFKQGMVMTIFAGIAWGFSGNCAEILFKNFGITPVYLSSMRMVFSGLILTIAALLTNRENLISMLKDKRSVLQLVLFALFGILFNQVSYLEAIHTPVYRACLLHDYRMHTYQKTPNKEGSQRHHACHDRHIYTCNSRRYSPHLHNTSWSNVGTIFCICYRFLYLPAYQTYRQIRRDSCYRLCHAYRWSHNKYMQ